MRTTVRIPLTVRLLALGAVLVLAGCSGGAATDGDTDPSGADASGGVTVTATDLAFDPADISLPAGASDLTLVNEGAVEHDITVDELDLRVHADAGETTTETVDLAAGTYSFYCSIPGHREAGMEGTLTVGG